MFIFVFQWAPALEHVVQGVPPHGIAFASFMVCLMLCSSVFKTLNAHHSVEALLPVVLATAAASLAVPIAATALFDRTRTVVRRVRAARVLRRAGSVTAPCPRHTVRTRGDHALLLHLRVLRGVLLSRHRHAAGAAPPRGDPLYDDEPHTGRSQPHRGDRAAERASATPKSCAHPGACVAHTVLWSARPRRLACRQRWASVPSATLCRCWR